jgi:hypothetical protein
VQSAIEALNWWLRLRSATGFLALRIYLLPHHPKKNPRNPRPGFIFVAGMDPSGGRSFTMRLLIFPGGAAFWAFMVFSR